MTDAAIPAATLILVRDRRPAPEILVVRRAQGMAFAGGAMVFPGGRIDPSDHLLGANGDWPAARVAAIRETLEETAIPVGVTPLPDRDTGRALQHALLAGQPFGGLLDRHGLGLDTDALIPLARWLPAFHAKRRFDTIFFIARAPCGDLQPHVVEGECSGAYWLSAQAVLDMEKAGEAQLIFPTRRTLERLALHASFDALEADAKAYPITPITPWIEDVGGTRHIAIPDDIGFPVVREPLDGQWRG